MRPWSLFTIVKRCFSLKGYWKILCIISQLSPSITEGLFCTIIRFTKSRCVERNRSESELIVCVCDSGCCRLNFSPHTAWLEANSSVKTLSAFPSGCPEQFMPQFVMHYSMYVQKILVCRVVLNICFMLLLKTKVFAFSD